MENNSILIIYTGGTIGMVHNPQTGMLEPFDFNQISDQMPELRRFGFNIDAVSFDPPMDSSDIGPDIWVNMASIIYERYNEYDGFVILHGTDTMSYSASALSFILGNLEKPVIFTGSQLPIGILRTDGKENIITAIEIAAAQEDGKALVPEVCIYFENKLYRGNRTTKINADDFNAFQSANYPPLAEVGISIKYNREAIMYPRDKKPIELNTDFDDNIAILKLFPGMNPAYVDSILNIPGLKGVILETFGSGNTPGSKWFINRIEKALEQNILILDVTQCKTGSVYLGRYKTSRLLYEAGVISGYDITTEAATTKMMSIFGNNEEHEKIKLLLNSSLRGEITIT